MCLMFGALPYTGELLLTKDGQIVKKTEISDILDRPIALQAYSRLAIIDLAEMKQRLTDLDVVRVGKESLEVRVSPQSYIFIFSHGSIVFCNTPEKDHERFLSLCSFSPQSNDTTRLRPKTASFAEDDFFLAVKPDQLSVDFNLAVIPRWEIGWARLICDWLGQSGVLEVIEREVERSVKKSELLTKTLWRAPWFSFKIRNLLRDLGRTLGTRHRIVTQLTMLSEPDIAWQDETGSQLYQGLLDNFDLRERVERVEKMIDLTSSVLELQIDLVKTRRSELLEITIVILILIEVIKGI